VVEILRRNRKKGEGRGIWQREVRRMVIWREIEIRIVILLE